jgi:RHS repeat-associated protein
LPRLFTGQEFDEESGLYFYRLRQYSPALGRFDQRDPMDYLDKMNLYEYIGDNPGSKTDAFGYNEDEGVQRTIDAVKREIPNITDTKQKEKMERWVKGIEDRQSPSVPPGSGNAR